MLIAIGCSGKSTASSPRDAAVTPSATPADAASSSVDAAAAALGACGDTSRREVLADGLELLTVLPAKAPAHPVVDRCLRALRADPARYELVVGSGPAKPAGDWAEELDAAAGINAAMFHHGGASTGLLVANGETLVDKVNDKFGASLAAGPRKKTAAVAMWGRGCPGGSVEPLRRNYRTVVQNYRMLDCDGAPIRWADPKVYSSAAVGVDREGRVLFIHLRAPYKMADVTEMLADPALDLDLGGAMHVEGGPEATLFVEAGGRRGQWVGSYESEFFENDGNSAAWPLPNHTTRRFGTASFTFTRLQCRSAHESSGGAGSRTGLDAVL